MKRRSAKKKAKKRVSRKKIKLKHNSKHRTANLQQVTGFKFPPFMKAYESFWEKRKKEKGKQHKTKNWKLYRKLKRKR